MQESIHQVPAVEDHDPNAEQRKQDHIELAFKSQVLSQSLDQRFYYEPILAAHPQAGSFPKIDFLGSTFDVPLWVSSMTGGTQMANTINHNLAKACGEFGFGMGLGSCRSLLTSDEYLPDFQVKQLMPDQPLYANLGIAQLEQLLKVGNYEAIPELLAKLQADGLIIHVNPMQEAMQPEGDIFEKSPLETIKTLLDTYDFPMMVKEVGQGMGFESLKALLQLPLAAVDFAASGGTNFALLELLRSEKEKLDTYRGFTHIGHSAEEMVDMVNDLQQQIQDSIQVKHIIISGGIKTFLDGFYLINKIQFNAVYGQASAFLKHAQGSYSDLQHYVASQVRGLELANAFLKIKG
ncbi:MAG: isopentenyl-diphosphate delta-isomerase [Bacteroidota bacterium]